MYDPYSVLGISRNASEEEIKLTANDMELGIETIIEGDILEKGIVAIDAKIFSEIVRKLPDNDVAIETDANFQTKITCEKAKFNISGKSGEDFSNLPYIEKEDYIADNISKAIFDERPIRVTMEEMIAAGYFQAGEKMFLKKGEVYAILTEDAKIRYRDEIYDLHHGAAVIKGAKADRLNGFTVWYVERDGYRVSIDEIREKYREDKLKR